jgi:hypothetical protein
MVPDRSDLPPMSYPICRDLQTTSGASSSDMDKATVLTLLGLGAGAFSTLWATGGWRALKRRKIQQETDIARSLDDGSKVKELLRETGPGVNSA